MSSNHHKLVIIGCGAAGITAGLFASRFCDDIVIFDRNETPAKKLPATGNGRCNYTNMIIDDDCFRSTDKEIAYRIYSLFDNRAAIEFFRSLGILPFEKNGYCYPHGTQAKAFTDVLINQLIARKIRLSMASCVQSITVKDCFEIQLTNGYSVCADRVVICPGGAASPVFGTDGSFFALLQKLGFKLHPFYPALTGLKLKLSDKDRVLINGVRVNAQIRLLDNSTNNEYYCETGEIIFSGDGISGIPIMNSSRFIPDHKETSLVCDLLPDINETELVRYCEDLYQNSRMTLFNTFMSLTNTKLLQYIFRRYKIDPDYKLHDCHATDCIKMIVSGLKALSFTVTGTNGFENAQTTRGGISLKAVNPLTMESREVPGLYFAGEILDTDGRCGGYNLQWAWTTGAIAGTYAGGGSL